MVGASLPSARAIVVTKYPDSSTIGPSISKISMAGSASRPVAR